MKRKNMVSGILVLALIGIWTIVALRYFDAKSAIAPEKIKFSSLQASEIKSPRNFKSFELSMNYSDPFLENIEVQKPIKSKRTGPKIMRSSKIPVPGIKYIGLMKAGKRQMVMVQYEGNQKFYGLGDILGAWKIQSFDQEELVIEAEGQIEKIDKE